MKQKQPERSFFSLPQPFWKLSDDELVERVQRNHRRIRKWHKWVHIADFVILAALLAVTVNVASNLFEDSSRSEVTTYWRGYVFGALMGGLFGFYLMKSVFLTVYAFGLIRERDVRLRSWNRCKQLEGILSNHDIKPPPAGLAKS